MVRTGDVRVRFGRSNSSCKKGGGGTRSSSATVSKISLGKSNSSIGGNPVCPRETPGWQKPITNFFQKVDQPEYSCNIRDECVEQATSNNVASSSKCTIKENEDSDESLKQLGCLEGKDSLSLENTKEEKTDFKSQTTLGSSTLIDKDSPEICKNSSSRRKRKLTVEDSPESPAFERLDETDDTTEGIRLVENESTNDFESGEKCKTPTTERKRKSTINILTPKRIHSYN